MEAKDSPKMAEVAPFLERTILEDPDPSSPLYIPKPPPRSYLTLEKALEKGMFVDDFQEPTLKPREVQEGVNFIDRARMGAAKVSKKDGKGKKTVRSGKEDLKSMGYQQYDSMGDPFGGGGYMDDFGGPFGAGPKGQGPDAPEGWIQDDDPFGGVGDPMFPNEESRLEYERARAARVRNPDYVDRDEYEEEEEMADKKEKARGRARAARRDAEEDDEEEGDDDQDYDLADENIGDDSKYQFKEPMYGPGDEELMADAIRLREKDGIPYHESRDFDDEAEGTGHSRPSAKNTGSSEVEEGAPETATTGAEVAEDEDRPRGRKKEEFRKDREQLQRIMDEEKERNPGEDRPPGEPMDDPSGLTTSPRPRSRIMTGQELRQQMAMQRLAAEALKAITKKGKGKGGGRFKVMFV